MLQWVFLPDPATRLKLVLPPPVKVDYRAACFCHRELIDIGYVCSVCLSSKAKQFLPFHILITNPFFFQSFVNSVRYAPHASKYTDLEDQFSFLVLVQTIEEFDF